MRPMINCSVIGGVVAAWLLVVPPFSVTPAGKTFVDASAPLFRWEKLSSHSDNIECVKHRDQLRESLEKAASNAIPIKKGAGEKNKTQAAFAGLRARLASARCVSSTDPRLSVPTAAPTAQSRKK
jgi:hypothetical protein